MDTPAKQKVTLTLPAEIVRALDAQAQVAGGTRSAIVARVLDEWQRQAAPISTAIVHFLPDAAARLDADTAAFYRAQGNDEREEDAAWAAFGARCRLCLRHSISVHTPLMSFPLRGCRKSPKPFCAP